MEQVRCCSGGSHRARLFVWAKRGSNGVQREYPVYVHAFPLQRVCLLNFFPPQASIGDYYDVITSPHDDSHHPTPPDNAG